MRYLVSRPDIKTTHYVQSFSKRIRRAEQAAAVFNLTKPTLAVYSHIGTFGGDESTSEFVDRTREHYPGRIILGEDLMTITIADDVKVSNELVK